MAGTINASESNEVAFYATLPSTNVEDRIIVDFEGQYVPDSYTDNVTAGQFGKWIKSTIPAEGVPPRDDYYNVSVYATSSGDIHWSHEDRVWADITETWAAIEGIVRGVLLNNSTMLVQGNEDYTAKQYISGDENINTKEYISNSESISDREYTSTSDQRNSKSYY